MKDFSYRIVFAFITSSVKVLIMTFFMTLILRGGFIEHFVKIWLKNYMIGFFIAFPLLIFVPPFVNKITSKITKKYLKYIFPLILSFIMLTIMSFIMTIINIGFHHNFISHWIKSGSIGFMISYPLAFVLVPQFTIITHKINNYLLDLYNR